MGSNFPSHWQLFPLEEVMEAIIDYRGKTPTKTSSGIPLITAKIVKDGRIQEPTEFIAEEDYDSWMTRGLPEVGDVVVTSEAPLGEVAQLTDSNIALAQRIVTLRGRKDILDNDYLLCAFQSAYVQNQLESRASGSTVKGIKQSELRKILLPIPPLNEQVEIAKQLKSLSDKIELNRQTNQTLEQIAQTLFKSWFVDFEPTRAKIAAKEAGASPEEIERAAMCAISGKTPDQLAQLPPETQQNLKTTAALFPDALADSELGEIPEGWTVESLGEFIDVKHGFAFPGEFFTDVDTRKILLTPGNFKIGGGFKLDKFKYYSGDVPADYILKKRDLLITMTDLSKEADTLGFPALVPEHDGVIFLHNQRLGKVIGKDGQLRRYFLYCLFRSQRYREEIISGITGTTVKHTAPRKILAFTYPFCQELEKVFDDFVFKIFSNIECLELQNSSLKTLRDTLLPKLLSGEIATTNVDWKRGEGRVGLR